MKISTDFYANWYKDGGLEEYEEVFRYNNEKEIEIQGALKLLSPHINGVQNESLKVLDIGCGTGKFTIQWNAEGILNIT